MIFHLAFELPPAPSKQLDEKLPGLTEEELRIVKQQIRRNSYQINDYVFRIELFVNKEKHPGRAPVVEKLRNRLDILMQENDTFRKVLWNHYQSQEAVKPSPKIL